MGKTKKNSKSKINDYLMSSDRLYKDWYLGFNQTKSTKDTDYTVDVSISTPSIDKIKTLFNAWFNQQKMILKKKLCDNWEYCYKKITHSSDGKALLIAVIADILTAIITKIPINILATATILYSGKYLNILCECE